MLPPAFFDQSSAHLLFSQVIRKDNVADETSNGISLDDKSLDLSECIFWEKNDFSCKSDFCSISFP